MSSRRSRSVNGSDGPTTGPTPALPRRVRTTTISAGAAAARTAAGRGALASSHEARRRASPGSSSGAAATKMRRTGRSVARAVLRAPTTRATRARMSAAWEAASPDRPGCPAPGRGGRALRGPPGPRRGGMLAALCERRRRLDGRQDWPLGIVLHCTPRVRAGTNCGHPPSVGRGGPEVPRWAYARPAPRMGRPRSGGRRRGPRPRSDRPRPARPLSGRIPARGPRGP